MMDGKKLEELSGLVEFLKTNGIAEFEMEQDDQKVRIKFAGAGGATPGIDLAQLGQLMRGGGENIPSLGKHPVAPPMGAGAELAAEMEEKLHDVKSPIVGTFYESPSPGAPPFVKIGDHVEVGQVLCIVEAMKLMNEIEADVAGEVVRRIASSGQPVEYGQSLFAIRER